MPRHGQATGSSCRARGEPYSRHLSARGGRSRNTTRTESPDIVSITSSAVLNHQEPSTSGIAAKLHYDIRLSILCALDTLEDLTNLRLSCKSFNEPMQAHGATVLLAIVPRHFQSYWLELLRVLRVYQAQNGREWCFVNSNVYTEPDLTIDRGDLDGIFKIYGMINRLFKHVAHNVWPICDMKMAANCVLLDLLVPAAGESLIVQLRRAKRRSMNGLQRANLMQRLQELQGGISHDILLSTSGLEAAIDEDDLDGLNRFLRNWDTAVAWDQKICEGLLVEWPALSRSTSPTPRES